MSKKELKDDQLEKVSGGTSLSSHKYLSGELTTNQAYEHVGENLFFYTKNGPNVYYCKLKRCWEDYGFLNIWSYTQYDVEIIETTGSNDTYWGPGCNQTLHSKEYKVYTNYTGPRPLI